MGPHDHVDLALPQPLDDGLLFLGRAEPGQQLHSGRESPEALGESVPVLLGQHGGRDQDGNLAAIGHGLEGGPQGNLGLAETHVAGDQAVHRARPFHVPLDVVDGLQLVGGLLEAEGGLELVLPRRVGREGLALGHRPGRVQLEKLLGHLAKGGPHGFLHALPLGAAQAVQARGRHLAPEVLGDQVEALDGQVELVVLGVFEEQEVPLAIADGHGAQTEVAPDPVVLVDHEVARAQIGEGGDGGAALELRTAERPTPRSEDLLLSEQDESQLGNGETRRTISDEHDGPRGSVRASQRLAIGPPALRAPHRGLELLLAQDCLEVFGLVGIGGHQQEPKSLCPPLLDGSGESPELTAEGWHALGLEGHLGDGALGGHRPRHERQLHDLPAAQRLAQRRSSGRALAVVFQELGGLDDHRGPGGQVVQQSRGVGRGVHAFGKRDHQELVDPARGALGGRIEQANRFDVVPEELQARRARVGRAEHVDDSAAHAPLPHLHHGFGALVARPLQRLQEQFAVEPVTDAQAKEPIGEVRQSGQGDLQPGRCRHHG